MAVSGNAYLIDRVLSYIILLYYTSNLRSRRQLFRQFPRALKRRVPTFYAQNDYRLVQLACECVLVIRVH